MKTQFISGKKAAGGLCSYGRLRLSFRDTDTSSGAKQSSIAANHSNRYSK